MGLDKQQDLGKYSLDVGFREEIRGIMDNFNSNTALWQNSQEMSELSRARSQVDQVTEIMKNNVNHVLNRGEALSDIVSQANALQSNASQFRTTATSVRRQMWCRNMKWTMIYCIVAIAVIVVVIVSISLG